MSANWRQGGGFRPKSNYWQKNDYKGKRKHQYTLEPGTTGFLCTCVGKFKEKECVRDGYNILNEYADEMFGPEVRNLPSKEKGQEAKCDDDVDASLKEELASLKNEREKPVNERRFQVIESGANGIVFIKTTVPDPVKLCHQIVSSIAESKVQKSKFLLRLLPVEVVCYANLNDITKAAEPLFDKYFMEGGKTFSIIFSFSFYRHVIIDFYGALAEAAVCSEEIRALYMELSPIPGGVLVHIFRTGKNVDTVSHRNNDRLSRDAVIDALASLVCAKNPTNKADLKAAQLAVLVEVIRGICCISVMPDYFKLKKYNILELCNVSSQSATDKGTEVEKDSAGEVKEADDGNKEGTKEEGKEIGVPKENIEKLDEGKNKGESDGSKQSVLQTVDIDDEESENRPNTSGEGESSK